MGGIHFSLSRDLCSVGASVCYWKVVLCVLKSCVFPKKDFKQDTRYDKSIAKFIRKERGRAGGKTPSREIVGSLREERGNSYHLLLALIRAKGQFSEGLS